jgi:hypothetical protein
MAPIQIVRPGEPCDGSSFEQERREILESVMTALATTAPDPDEMAACDYLLQHLAGSLNNRPASLAVLPLLHPVQQHRKLRGRIGMPAKS